MQVECLSAWYLTGRPAFVDLVDLLASTFTVWHRTWHRSDGTADSRGLVEARWCNDGEDMCHEWNTWWCLLEAAVNVRKCEKPFELLLDHRCVCLHHILKSFVPFFFFFFLTWIWNSCDLRLNIIPTTLYRRYSKLLNVRLKYQRIAHLECFWPLATHPNFLCMINKPSIDCLTNIPLDDGRLVSKICITTGHDAWS